MIKMDDWMAKPEEDAFLLELKNGIEYFYAINADLKNQGRHYYKMTRDSIDEVEDSEIVDLLKSKREIIEACPCIRIENGHIKPFITRD